MRNDVCVLESGNFIGRVADSPSALGGARIQLPHPAHDVRLGEIDRIFLNRDDRQKVLMPGDMYGVRRLIAARDAVAPSYQAS